MHNQHFGNTAHSRFQNMNILTITNSSLNKSTTPQVATDSFSIRGGEFWAIVGSNGSGKSTFCQMLCDANPLLGAQIVSFESEQQLLEHEIYEDDSEFIDKQDPGRTPREILAESLVSGVSLDWLEDALHLADFMETGFRLLSTGERRRLMIAIALSRKAKLLILDEPFDGLDKHLSRELAQFIDHIQQSTPTVLVLNRLSQLAGSVTHVACLSQMKLVYQGSLKDAQDDSAFRQLRDLNTTHKKVPPALKSTRQYNGDRSTPIVDLKKIKVAYQSKTILSGLDWRIMPGEQWRVSGPNGCGKSTLVNLVTGDHPQCYSNEIYLFGKKRGIGESIWDVKHFMGIMSTTLHQQYRVTVTAESVLLSGFFDTIGVYRPTTAEHKAIAASWLKYLGMESLKDANFQRLSFGQQRMLLIARALIKRPSLLILDEPCQGLDPLNRALVLHLIDEIIAGSIAQVIYISHEPEDTLASLTHKLEFTPPARQPKEGEMNYAIDTSRI